jgi:uncharacterized small protein (DUF1192 family)
MDQLLAKIKEVQPLYQAADAQVQTARQALAKNVDDAYERLRALNQAEHELLVALISQRQQVDERMALQQAEIERLQQQLEPETIPEENVAAPAEPKEQK